MTPPLNLEWVFQSNAATQFQWRYKMLPASSDNVAQTLYAKAVSAGLTKVTVELSDVSLVNYQSTGRRTDPSKSISFKGSDEQENAFKGSLVGTEAESLEIEKLGLSAGDDCPEFKVFNAVTGEEVQLHWRADDPKVYLIDFWATWCGPCQHPMAHNQEMLEHNPGWEGKAEILAISLDDTKEAPTTRIQEKGWTKVTNYWGGEGAFNSQGPALFKVNGIPTCLLVKKGKILWRGHPSERKLEADITHLTTSDDLPKGDEAAAGPGEAAPIIHSGEELEQLLVKVDGILGTFIAANPTLTSPFFVHILNTKLNEDGQTQTARSITGGGYLARYKGIVEATVEKIKELFPSVELRYNYQEPVATIARGNTCSLCAKVLSEQETQYLCPYCEPLHYHCQGCEDLPREGKGSAKLAHPHKVYKITSASGHFDELRFGKNIPEDAILVEDPTERAHHCGCDNRRAGGACDGKVEGVRYKCAHCRDVDFCEACEKLFWGTATEEMKEKIKGAGHEEWHVLLKIPFP